MQPPTTEAPQPTDEAGPAFSPPTSAGQRKPLASRTITLGLATAAAMWVAYLALHLPGFHAPGEVLGPTMIALLLAGGFVAGRTTPPNHTAGPTSRRPWRSAAVSGLLVGLIAAAINLLVLGSLLAEQPETLDPTAVTGATRPDAPVAAAGFLVLGALTGTISALAGLATLRLPTHPDLDPTPPASARTWAARLAIVAAVTFLPLLAIGGATTSAEAGFAVPDWPGSYGANMFLFPISQMAEPRIFLEHSHRLLGSLVGLSVLILFLTLMFTRGITRPQRLASLALLIAVSIQGVVGGVWVLKQHPALAVTHGVSAQLVFAAAVGLAVWLHRSANRARSTLPTTHEQAAALPAAKPARFTLAVLIVMLVMGAWYRHTHAPHPLWTHMALSLLATGAVAWTGFTLLRADATTPPGRVARRLGTALVAIVATQFTLGVITFFLVTTGSAAGSTGPNIPQADELATTSFVPPIEALFATLHQFVGATLIGTVALTVAWAWTARRPKTTSMSATMPANAPTA